MKKNNTSLTKIGLYNQKVHEYLQNTTLDAITQLAVKLFEDNAQRNKLNDAQYNKAVEEFNTQHGYLLLKKGKDYEKATSKHYNYINYPFLDRNAMKSTMDNYRQYVHSYNQQAIEYNKTIAEYNKTVIAPNTPRLAQQVADFTKKYRSEFTSTYNKKVAKFNAQKNANYIAKKRKPTIKYTTELLFNVLVGFYIAQLKQRNSYLLEMNRSTSVLKNALPKLTIDHRKLATHTIAEIPRLAICKKTAQNHIKRLREANILINYTYTNQYKPITVNFHPEILTILDGNPPKPKRIENQFFKQENWKELPDNNDTTRTFLLKEKEIKDCVNNTEFQKEEFTCPADGFYKNTTVISKKTTTRPRQTSEAVKALLPDFLKQEKPSQGTNSPLTHNFLARLQDDRELAQELADGVYDNYKGLRYDYLQKIELYANVTTEEFKAILLQDCIKTSAKLWKQHNVYVGEWKKAINYLNNELFTNITQKTTLIQKLKEYRWKLEFARKWFIKSQVTALYPSLYFDKTRTQTHEIGFFGLHKVWKTHVKYQEQKAIEKAQQQTQQNARKRKATYQKKITTAIKKYEKGNYTAKQLYTYVQTNLPHSYLSVLPTMITHKHQNRT
ncbi:hypothetical protein CSC81_04605 [Tenacibaculum discolor]|uniref:Uncharacterized protein n=1 Tax=Tenacibaculum discolor TaxID=361581 RepID=A0A2G1BUL3_9FLAO|nr:hypothetical protein [Tenacibaculum discolor]MDP2542697.1 hypothetical protein [Tenacibaculum discolor]PHN97696.1 hypothetical protein CSC81_04605 [Tenacibaculum discolor]PHO01703.1 hypothetical protein CSC82_22235 [Rhodobacteraceae bacterium 4F10]